MDASLRPNTTSDAVREAFQTFSPDKATLTATAVLSIFRQHPDWRELSPAQLGYLACCRFRGQKVFGEAGGGPWDGECLRENLRLRRSD
jgi:hypothetical protein